MSDTAAYIRSEQVLITPYIMTVEMFNARVVESMFSIETDIINSRELVFRSDMDMYLQSKVRQINDMGLRLLLSLIYHDITPRVLYAASEVTWGVLRPLNYPL